MMDIDLIGGIGWRDLVLVVAAMIGVYLVLSVMRLFRVAAKPRDAAQPGVGHQFSGSPADPAAQNPAPEFARELARSSVEVELQSLRREGAVLREELARLSDEVSRLKAAHHVSPLYNEAMALAQQGMPATGIAGLCGISIGEAELVAALARGGAEFELHQQGEDRNERNTDSGNRLHG